MKVLITGGSGFIGCQAARPGDQCVYVSDIRRAGELLGWRPRISVAERIERLYHWVSANPDLFAEKVAAA